MLNRTQFLATGLVPFTLSTQEFNDECSICLSLLTNPVKISICGHIFDKPCIEQWIHTDGRNTCPLCNCKLYGLDGTEDRGPTANLREQVGSALRASRIGEPNALSLISTYNIDTSNISLSSWQRATAQATFYLGQNRRRIPGEFTEVPGSDVMEYVTGPGVIRIEKLAPNFLAMGNLIRPLARAAGRPYDERQAADWDLSLKVIWHELKHNDKKKIAVLRIAEALIQNAREELSKRMSNVDEIDFLRTPTSGETHNQHRDDLFLLLNYLALLCWRTHRDERPSVKAGVRPSGKNCIFM